MLIPIWILRWSYEFTHFPGMVEDSPPPAPPGRCFSGVAICAAVKAAPGACRSAPCVARRCATGSLSSCRSRQRGDSPGGRIMVSGKTCLFCLGTSDDEHCLGKTTSGNKTSNIVHSINDYPLTIVAVTIGYN